MPKFDELGYGGGELTCSLCNDKVFYTTFNRYRYSDRAEYEWGYQCQDCGEQKISKENIEERQYLIERCACGGQFRRDRNLFCKNCKGNKTEENTSDENVFFFNEKTGEPNAIKHNTSEGRKGKEMTSEELNIFGIELIAKFFKSQGMIIVKTDFTFSTKTPHIIMKSINGVNYYLIVKVGLYPTNSDALFKNEYPDLVKLAKLNNAKPSFAGISLANILNEEKDFGKAVCGSLYAVSFQNLFQLV